MGVGTIHVTLVHQRKYSAILLEDEIFYLLVRIRLLTLELVARKCKYLKSSVIILFVKFYQLLVVCFSKGSI